MFKRVVTLFSIVVVFVACEAMAMEQLKDPTKPLVGVSSSGELVLPADGYLLQSVFVSGKKKRAIINNKKVLVGDTVGEYKVVNIQRNRVTLQNDSDTLELNLFRQAVTK